LIFRDLVSLLRKRKTKNYNKRAKKNMLIEKIFLSLSLSALGEKPKLEKEERKKERIFWFLALLLPISNYRSRSLI